MNPSQQKAWREHADWVIRVPARDTDTSVAPDAHLDVTDAFGREAPLVVEIGGGTGDVISAVAAKHPDRNYLAFEVFEPAVASTLSKCARAGVDNVRVVVANGVDAVATLMYLWALFHLPMANAIAINLSPPIFLSIFAAVFLREQVGAVRWAAIGAGFLGVLLIIQPQSQGFNAFALLCLLAPILHAVRDLLTRRIPASTPAILITLATAAPITVVSGLVSLVQGWQGFGARELGLLGLASVFLACGYYFIISSMRQGDMSLTAPFRYSGLLLALVLGYLVWGDVPNTFAWCGIALLVGSGLFMLWCERLRVRRLAAF